MTENGTAAGCRAYTVLLSDKMYAIDCCEFISKEDEVE